MPWPALTAGPLPGGRAHFSGNRGLFQGGSITARLFSHVTMDGVRRCCPDACATRMRRPARTPCAQP
eukprot:2839122-Rhodomonas_salina.1